MKPLAATVVVVGGAWAIFFALLLVGYFMKVPPETASNAGALAQLGFFIHSLHSLGASK